MDELARRPNSCGSIFGSRACWLRLGLCWERCGDCELCPYCEICVAGDVLNVICIAGFGGGGSTGVSRYGDGGDSTICPIIAAWAPGTVCGLSSVDRVKAPGESDRFREFRGPEDVAGGVGTGTAAGGGDGTGGVAGAGDVTGAVVGLRTVGGPDSGVSALIAGRLTISGGE